MLTHLFIVPKLGRSIIVQRSPHTLAEFGFIQLKLLVIEDRVALYSRLMKQIFFERTK